MSKKLTRCLMFFFIICIAFILSGCKDNNNDDDNNNSKIDDIVGEYEIDITNLGMALSFYLKIDEDGNFILSPDRKFIQDKGSGTIGELDGTYMMIYNDSTSENPKTSTFERIGHNLIFRSNLIYGSAKICHEKEDEDDPNIIYHLIANKYIYEEYYDSYLGFHSEDNIDYEFKLELKPGARYYYVSNYKETENQKYEETGLFEIDENTICLKQDSGVETCGLINEDGDIEIKVKLSESKGFSDQVLRVATTAEYASTYYSYASGTDYEINATLELDYFGGYTFTSDLGNEVIVDEGSFEIDGTSITFLSNKEGSSPKVGVCEEFIITVEFNVSEDILGVQFIFYDDEIQGTLSGSTAADESYLATLDLYPDGTFDLVIVNEDSETNIRNESGTFSISSGAMYYMLTLTSSEVNVGNGKIMANGIKLTLDIQGVEYDFMLTK